MRVDQLRGYGAAFSEAEAAWPADVKQRMRKRGNAVIMANLGPLQKIRFALAFLRARRRARRLDLSDLHAKGMTDEVFLDQQLEYIAAFAALEGLLGVGRAVEIMQAVMDETAREPLLLCLPKPDNVRRVGDDPLAVFRDYLRVVPESAARAGCNTIVVAEDDARAFQFNVTWCVWLELATRMGVSDACRPNCYADDLVFPDYFAALGIAYRRTQTLACGGTCCDFRFERPEGAPADP